MLDRGSRGAPMGTTVPVKCCCCMPVKSLWIHREANPCAAITTMDEEHNETSFTYIHAYIYNMQINIHTYLSTICEHMIIHLHIHKHIKGIIWEGK